MLVALALAGQIACPGGINASYAAISTDRIITAEHAVAAGGCGTTPIWYDKPLDLYIGVPSEPIPESEVYTVSCEGVVDGETYELRGYAETRRGTATPGYRTIETENGVHDNTRAIDTPSVTGMSGGAVVNDSGHLVGVITATNGRETFVRDFSTTSLCGS